MKIQHSLDVMMVLLCVHNVVRCYDIVITARRNWWDTDTDTIDVGFSLQQFQHFYECLCTATTQQCLVTLSFRYYNTYNPLDVERYRYQVQPNKESPPCKYYQCYSIFPSSFKCATEESHSCGISPRNQSIHYRSADCGDIRCVVISWEFPGEKVDYNDVPSTVYSCNNSCGCSTRASARPTTIRTTTERPHTSTEKRKTSTPSKQTTTLAILKTSEAETALQTTGTSNPTEETTSQEIRDTTETNTTASSLVSDNQTHDPIPIIVGVVVASMLFASVAAVLVFLWKRKKNAAQKPASDCHEYVNLPPASVCTKGVDTANAVNLRQEPATQFTNYATVNDSFDNDCDGANYATLTNKSNDSPVQSDIQRYVNCQPRRNRPVPPEEPKQTKVSSTGITDGYVTVTNTLEETDDFTNSIYELAHHSPDPVLASASVSNTKTNFHSPDPGLASASVSNTKTDFHDLYSENSKKESCSNDTNAAVTTRAHTNKDNAYKNDTSYPAENTNTNTEPCLELQNLQQQVGNYLPKPTKGTTSNSESVYSLSNDDVDADTTYSMATNSTSDMGGADTSRPHVYAHLGRDTRNIVNPYNSLRPANDANVPTQAKLQKLTLGKSSDTIQPYSLAEPIYEYQRPNDSENSYQVIDSTNDDDDDEQCVDTYTTPYENASKGISQELLNQSDGPSSCQMPNDGIYFELEK